MYVSLKSNTRDLLAKHNQLETTSVLFRYSIYVYAYIERCMQFWNMGNNMGKENKIPKPMQGFENKPLFMEMCADSFNLHIPTPYFKHTQHHEKSKKLVVNQMKPQSSDPAQETQDLISLEQNLASKKPICSQFFAVLQLLNRKHLCSTIIGLVLHSLYTYSFIYFNKFDARNYRLDLKEQLFIIQ